MAAQPSGIEVLAAGALGGWQPEVGIIQQLCQQRRVRLAASGPVTVAIERLLAVLLDPAMAWFVSALVVLLLMTYLITSTDSAILIVNTINGAGETEGDRRHHIIFWGAALAFVVGSMLVLGGIDAIRITMIIGALPFSFVLAAMGVGVVKAVLFDLIRKKQGVPTTSAAVADDVTAPQDTAR